MRFYELLKKQFDITRVSGVPVRADHRWIFVILILSFAVAFGIDPLIGNALSSFAFGLSATLIFFASILLHEYAHAFAAKREGLHVVEIVLHPFGGFTRFRHEPETPRAEFRIAAAGPAASLALAVIFGILAVAAAAIRTDILAVLLVTLAIGNLLLAVFNLLPGYPLDGGRVLRAYLWQNGRDLNEATKLTGRFGQAIGGVLVVSGIVFSLLRGDLFTGLWAVIVGFFLFDSARSLIAEVDSTAHLFAGDVMMLPVLVAPEATIQEFVDRTLPLNRQTAYPVSADRQLYGILLLNDIRDYGREAWTKIKVREVMVPITAELFVDVQTPLPEAFRQLRQNGVNALGVIDPAGQLVGFIHGSSTGTKRKT